MEHGKYSHKILTKMKVLTYTGTSTKKNMKGAYYVHPTLKFMPYKKGFEFVLWFIKYFVAIRIYWY